jgi:hypothetical protein
MDFYRFPHTPHLSWLGEGTPRDDKVLPPTEAKALLAGEVVVEEKRDGANPGLSLGSDEGVHKITYVTSVERIGIRKGIQQGLQH